MKEYVNSVRMEKAEAMLLSGVSIARIAKAVGYSTVQAFTTAFTQSKGVSPAKFRNDNAIQHKRE